MERIEVTLIPNDNENHVAHRIYTYDNLVMILNENQNRAVRFEYRLGTPPHLISSILFGPQTQILNDRDNNFYRARPLEGNLNAQHLDVLKTFVKNDRTDVIRYCQVNNQKRWYYMRELV